MMGKKRRLKKLETKIRRPLTPKQSLEASLKEVKLIKGGFEKGKPWKQLYNELKMEK
jgi:hypothetical protein